MSPSTAGLQLTRTTQTGIPHLPPEIWTEIFLYLDIGTLFNMVKAMPELEGVLFNPPVLRRVTFDAERNRDAAVEFLRTRWDDLVEDVPLSLHIEGLYFHNNPLGNDMILIIAEQCRYLRELCCVGIRIEPDDLFSAIYDSLECLEKLEWTLYDLYSYHRTKFDEFLPTPIPGGPILNELDMYVEHDHTWATVCVLKQFLTLCHRLRHLHIHDIREDPLPAINTDVSRKNFTLNKDSLVSIIHQIPSLQTFKNTCEMPLSRKREARTLSLRNNIAWHRKPEPSFNVVGISEVVKQEASVRSMEQVMVTVKANTEAPTLFERAAAKPELWQDVSQLTLVLTPDKASDNLTPPTLRSVLVKWLGEFFDTCVSKLTELNLSTCHFESGCDCCSVVASTLSQLHSLALPPCGANLENSLEHLARGCKLLVRLEVRSVDTVSSAAPCEECKRPLQFTESSFELLHRETCLRELSIDDTAQIASLSFLLGCRVEELRLPVDSPKDVGPLLAANTRLSSLTIVTHDAAVWSCAPTPFEAVTSLRHLCVITNETCVSRVVDEFFFFVERHLPQLQTAHLHSKPAWDGPRFIGNEAWFRHDGHDYGTDGHFLKGKIWSRLVSSTCSYDGFIGMVRPVYRYHRYHIPLLCEDDT